RNRARGSTCMRRRAASARTRRSSRSHAPVVGWPPPSDLAAHGALAAPPLLLAAEALSERLLPDRVEDVARQVASIGRVTPRAFTGELRADGRREPLDVLHLRVSEILGRQVHGRAS